VPAGILLDVRPFALLAAAQELVGDLGQQRFH
jgi:hypothetical protein